MLSLATRAARLFVFSGIATKTITSFRILVRHVFGVFGFLCFWIIFAQFLFAMFTNVMFTCYGLSMASPPTYYEFTFFTLNLSEYGLVLNFPAAPTFSSSSKYLAKMSLSVSKCAMAFCSTYLRSSAFCSFMRHAIFDGSNDIIPSLVINSFTLSKICFYLRCFQPFSKDNCTSAEKSTNVFASFCSGFLYFCRHPSSVKEKCWQSKFSFIP